MGDTQTFAEPTGDTGSVDVDSVLSQVDSGSSGDRQMSAEPTAEPTQKEAPQSAAELAFQWNGKQIKAPLNDPRVTQWVSQGYDYAQKMQAFKQSQSEFEQKQRALADIEQKYKPLEEYYSQNPDRWQYINQQYEALKQGLDPADPVSQKFQSILESKLKPYDNFIQQLQQREIAFNQQQEDTVLNDEIQSIRNNYKDLDWANADAEGKNLELKVLEHAQKIGTSSFRAAFRDFHHDQLVKLAEERAKESVVKDKVKNTKLGLLGQSQAPTKGITNAGDIKQKTYDDLTREALEEFGIG
jgi:hypothetical protein